MTTTKSDIATALDAGSKVDVLQQGGRLKVFECTITLASQADGDDIELFDLPAGFKFSHGMLHGSATLGSSTIAIGITGTLGKYRAAATHTATVPTLFGATSVAKLTAKERVRLTNTTAALPASGTLKIAIYGTVGD